ncbi:MAG: ANTAR domain-containing response regulator [Oscillospiraceae bacterium]
MISEPISMSVLIVSSSQKATEYLIDLLPQNQFSPISAVSSAGEAKRLLIDKRFDIVIINSPLPDDFGIQLSIEIAENNTSGVVLFVKNDIFEQVAYKVEGYGVFTVGRPSSKQIILQAIKLMVAVRAKILFFENKASSLKEKMEEIRLVNRAKLVLMQNLNMTEQDAHRYIEKTAMDTCSKRRTIAENIIKTYES